MEKKKGYSMFERDKLDPVSYTHLDVYKRQPLSRFMQKQQIKRQYAKSARKGGAKTAQKAAENKMCIRDRFGCMGRHQSFGRIWK